MVGDTELLLEPDDRVEEAERRAPRHKARHRRSRDQTDQHYSARELYDWSQEQERNH